MSAKFWEVMRKTVYKPEETLEQFAVRVGRALLPGQEDSWYEEHAFLLHLAGLNKCACAKCQGTCPHHGHRFGLKLNEHTGILLLVAEAKQCEKYQRTEGEG